MGVQLNGAQQKRALPTHQQNVRVGVGGHVCARDAAHGEENDR